MLPPHSPASKFESLPKSRGLSVAHSKLPLACAPSSSLGSGPCPFGALGSFSIEARCKQLRGLVSDLRRRRGLSVGEHCLWCDLWQEARSLSASFPTLEGMIIK